MSASVRVIVTENVEKKELSMQVSLEQEGGTELEKAIVTRLQPFIGMCLDKFESLANEAEKRDQEIKEATESRIVLP
jgi:hypothetical protein